MWRAARSSYDARNMIYPVYTNQSLGDLFLAPDRWSGTGSGVRLGHPAEGAGGRQGARWHARGAFSDLSIAKMARGAQGGGTGSGRRRPPRAGCRAESRPAGTRNRAKCGHSGTRRGAAWPLAASLAAGHACLNQTCANREEVEHCVSRERGGNLAPTGQQAPRRRPAGRQAAGRAGACFASVRMPPAQV